MMFRLLERLAGVVSRPLTDEQLAVVYAILDHIITAAENNSTRWLRFTEIQDGVKNQAIGPCESKNCHCVLTTIKPPYLHNLISVHPLCNTRTSSLSLSYHIVYSCLFLRQLVTDFHNYFILRLTDKSVMKSLLKILPYLAYVATLPCQIFGRHFLTRSGWWLGFFVSPYCHTGNLPTANRSHINEL